MPPHPSWKLDLLTFLKGLAMGGADVVPGVSGGTVALIVGIYRRLVGAISSFDAAWLRLLAGRRWREAAAHVDARFLLALGLGIGTGIVALGGLMHTLLHNPATEPATLAAFLGMIVASVFLVARHLPPVETPGRLAYLAAAAVGALFAWWFCGLTAGEEIAQPSLPYVFLCGAIAICAMILPGISGAYLLLILGLYKPLTAILKRLPRGEVDGADLLTVAVFLAGCLVGLLLFSRVLRGLLARAYGPTMALLCGFMLGALRNVWPFEGIPSPLHALLCAVVAAAAGIGVLLLARLAAERPKSPPQANGAPRERSQAA